MTGTLTDKMSRARDFIGVIPAGGRGKRMQPYNGLKELLPIGYDEINPCDREIRIVPKVVSQYVLESMQQAQVRNVLFVLSPQKLEILRFYGSGTYVDMQIGYLCQEIPQGMPNAIDLAYSWAAGKTVLMGMPDTILKPSDCFAQLLDFHCQKSADLSLGVFPTQRPQHLAPVRIDPESQRVLQIFDKPKTPPCFNTWGIAIWSPKFTELLHNYVLANADAPKELLLSDVFSKAVDDGLGVYGYLFPDGKYYDIGTPEGLLKARYKLEYSHAIMVDLHKKHAE